MNKPSARRKENGQIGADIINDGSSMLTNSPQQQSKHLEAGTIQVADSLCEGCAKINVDIALSKKSPTIRGSLVKKLGRIEKWNIDSCSLCRWLAIAEKISGGYRELRSYSSKKLYMGWKSVDVNMLGFDSKGPFLVLTRKTKPLSAS